MTMKKTLCGGLLLFVLSGCGGYLQVIDPASKNIYYTEEVNEVKGGAVKFIDAKTGSQVTLQNSEVKEISGEEFKAAIGKK
jgi:hypothetical protein